MTLSAGLLDLVGGLPVHPLIVHVAVVVLPAAAVGLIVIMALPRVHSVLRWSVIAALAVGTFAAWIAAESGEALSDRVGEAEVHEALGENLPTIAIITLVLGVIWAAITQLSAHVGPAASSAVITRSTGPRALLWLQIIVSIVTAGMAAYALYTIIVGHSGAVATWLPRVGG